MEDLYCTDVEEDIASTHEITKKEYRSTLNNKRFVNLPDLYCPNSPSAKKNVPRPHNWMDIARKALLPPRSTVKDAENRFYDALEEHNEDFGNKSKIAKYILLRRLIVEYLKVIEKKTRLQIISIPEMPTRLKSSKPKSNCVGDDVINVWYFLVIDLHLASTRNHVAFPGLNHFVLRRLLVAVIYVHLTRGDNKLEEFKKNHFDQKTNLVLHTNTLSHDFIRSTLKNRFGADGLQLNGRNVKANISAITNSCIGYALTCIGYHLTTDMIRYYEQSCVNYENCHSKNKDQLMQFPKFSTDAPLYLNESRYAHLIESEGSQSENELTRLQICAVLSFKKNMTPLLPTQVTSDDDFTSSVPSQDSESDANDWQQHRYNPTGFITDDDIKDLFLSDDWDTEDIEKENMIEHCSKYGNLECSNATYFSDDHYPSSLNKKRPRDSTNSELSDDDNEIKPAVHYDGTFHKIPSFGDRTDMESPAELHCESPHEFACIESGTPDLWNAGKVVLNVEFKNPTNKYSAHNRIEAIDVPLTDLYDVRNENCSEKLDIPVTEMTLVSRVSGLEESIVSQTVQNYCDKKDELQLYRTIGSSCKSHQQNRNSMYIAYSAIARKNDHWVDIKRNNFKMLLTHENMPIPNHPNGKTYLEEFIIDNSKLVLNVPFIDDFTNLSDTQWAQGREHFKHAYRCNRFAVDGNQLVRYNQSAELWALVSVDKCAMCVFNCGESVAEDATVDMRVTEQQEICLQVKMAHFQGYWWPVLDTVPTHVLKWVNQYNWRFEFSHCVYHCGLPIYSEKLNNKLQEVARTSKLNHNTTDGKVLDLPCRSFLEGVYALAVAKDLSNGINIQWLTYKNFCNIITEFIVENKDVPFEYLCGKTPAEYHIETAQSGHLNKVKNNFHPFEKEFCSENGSLSLSDSPLAIKTGLMLATMQLCIFVMVHELNATTLMETVKKSGVWINDFESSYERTLPVGYLMYFENCAYGVMHL